jgi:hypothetical protein
VIRLSNPDDQKDALPGLVGAAVKVQCTPSTRGGPHGYTRKLVSTGLYSRTPRMGSSLSGIGRVRPPVGRVLHRSTMVHGEGPVSTHYGQSGGMLGTTADDSKKSLVEGGMGDRSRPEAVTDPTSISVSRILSADLGVNEANAHTLIEADTRIDGSSVRYFGLNGRLWPINPGSAPSLMARILSARRGPHPSSCVPDCCLNCCP